MFPAAQLPRLHLRWRGCTETLRKEYLIFGDADRKPTWRALRIASPQVRNTEDRRTHQDSMRGDQVAFEDRLDRLEIIVNGYGCHTDLLQVSPPLHPPAHSVC
jgi:hypothetical protein